MVGQLLMSAAEYEVMCVNCLRVTARKSAVGPTVFQVSFSCVIFCMRVVNEVRSRGDVSLTSLPAESRRALPLMRQSK